MLDDTSKAIIARLQQDGRAAYSSIAREIGLSEAAVRGRVQRLLDAEVLQIVAVTDPAQVGFRRQAMIGLRVTGALGDVAQRLGELPEIAYVVMTAGRFDLLIEVVCEDDEHLLELLTDTVRTMPGVTDTETLVYLKLHKQRYDWGTR
ncbi:MULTISPECIES: Lrp/AsnC family transcriptional regulator [unclassified Allobranchiibius]|uniref:Lrp/AsnC family transcriptional regulator n=1 Tax=unclassified Allobranchiibius TaxID=2649857 RepID=UPI001AA166F7|nr:MULTISPECIES: Lrp/AsnC family transcriptional regulator [unclassified Allobranchiibius]MBO1768510.1 Lrp/AsnC family transcriptional regulator [Allobranchiibius sp. GilTou38]UIJ36600.1 Lrp/AsnC family transcriptional regulator [Allobranchiibius sp. GilTou73]